MAHLSEIRWLSSGEIEWLLTVKFCNDCNEKLLLWMEEKSNRRHVTTRKKPKEVFLDIEQKSLNKLPIEPFTIY
jgi:hypothetical protein